MGALRLFRIFAQRTQKVAATENDAYLTKPKQQRRMKKKKLKTENEKTNKKVNGKAQKKNRRGGREKLWQRPGHTFLHKYAQDTYIFIWPP